jgi:transcriptional regulator GlxA family with amidase domain
MLGEPAMKTLSITAAVVLSLVTSVPGAWAAGTMSAPVAKTPLKVAFVVTENANLIDLAGAWEVFQDTEQQGVMQGGFELFVVSNTKTPINVGGTKLVPTYTFAEAPKADIVSVGATTKQDGMYDYLRERAAAGAIIMSVCTGAYRLAAAGLLDGKNATTHHDYFDHFHKNFPNVTLVKGNRYVQAGPKLYTAGGLTSGIDLALHVVELTYGRAVAQKTANYMEYTGEGWKKPESASPLTD